MHTSGFAASPKAGAAAGLGAVALYAAGGLLVGTPADYGGPAGEAVAYLTGRATQIQLGAALFAASAPLLVWFLATVAALAREHGPAAALAGSVAYGCGLASLTLFMADSAALVVGTLRPANARASPELASALLDFSFVAIAMASFLTAAVFAACAVIALREGVLWPRWVGLLGLAAAVACTLRVGTLFTVDGPFTAGGLLGFWLPVAGFVGWVALGSLVLVRRVA
jgi:hypothetical protein